MSRRLPTVLLWTLALILPVGALLQPWLLPTRGALPIIPRGLNLPILLVTVPGLRADRVHHLGYARETTPNLDRMLRHGVSFTRAYSASNDAGASLAALHAARHPRINEVLTSADVLPERRNTLADRLGPHGYDTMAVLSDPSVSGMGLEQGFKQVISLPAGSSSDDVFEHALRFVDETPSRKWFVWVDLPDLLPPYGGDFADVQRFAPELPEGFGTEPPVAFLDKAELRRRGWGPTELQWLSDRYDGALHHLDAAIGRFLDALDERMLLQTMTVCVTGTRGDTIADRSDLAVAHGIDLYEPSIHVPLIFRLPAQQVRGRLLDEVARTVDIGPTLLLGSLRHGPRSEWIDACGKSLLEIMTLRRKRIPRAYTQGRHLTHGSVTAAGPAGTEASRIPAAVSNLSLSQAVRADRYKLIHILGSGSGVEMYNLSQDPREQSDKTGLQPVVTGALIEMSETWANSCGGQ